MKYLFTFILGCICTASIIFIFSHSNAVSRGIQISVENDTAEEVEKVVLITSSRQVFTCTFLSDQCNIALINSGDISIEIQVLTKMGHNLHGSIGYAESGSNHSVYISALF